MRNQYDYLFCDEELSQILAQRGAALEKEIEDQPSNYILNVNLDDHCSYLEQKYWLDMPVLRTDAIQFDPQEADVDVSQDPNRWIRDRNRPVYLKGTVAAFIVPFDGDGSFFRYKPSSWTTVRPCGHIVGNELHLIYRAVEMQPEQVKTQFQSDLNRIQQYLTWVTDEAVRFNYGLKANAQRLVEQRRQRLLKNQNLAAAIGFPLKPRADAPQTYSVPVNRKRLAVQKPVASAQPFQPEHNLEMQRYEEILHIISNMTHVMERSPQAFRKMKEEDFRQHYLVQLNGQYEGQATGETFNFEGKTDILIRAEGPNVFIAECKFWKGEKVLLETIDQLLGYAQWRDTKTAIILFNRNKNLSAVLEKIPEVIKQHPNFKQQLNYQNETGFRFVLHQRDDRNREVILTVLVFEVPT